MKRISIYFIMLVAAFSLSIGVQAKTITVTTAGTLSSYLSSEETQTVTELIISGPLNGTDIALIRTTAGNLERLDLTNATIVEGGTPYTSYNGQDYMTQNNIVGSYMFRGMVNLIDLKFPKNVVGLGSYTKDGYYSTWSGYSVSNCPSLETVTLPSTLLWIGEYSFDTCSRLKEIIIPEGVKIMGQYTFKGCQSLKKASLPSTLTDSFTYDGCTFTSQYNSGNNFADCTNLEEVILPEGLTLLYSYMFSGATSIKHITLPSTLKVINSAFNGCSGLLELELPSGLTQLGSMYGCSSLKSLVIPESVTEVGSFRSCTQLESITLPSGLAGWLPNFNDCSNLKSITIPDNVIVIDRRNFEGCI
ncbi:leucine-rich repeat domain-containing protein [Bacteroides nordii]|uniref:leucine-rich repeat domain-containing protein n=1 Tax=Bacteroides nordii TaxID=291645 RepID=UPI00241FB54F|nr:leucine-rich repeat domain-containing protein [Bacteroides nordii]